MSANLKVNVSQKTSGVESYWTGAVELSGMKNAVVARQDGTTKFSSKSSLQTAARALGKRLGLEVDFVETARKAAKVSVRTKTTN